MSRSTKHPCFPARREFLREPGSDTPSRSSSLSVTDAGPIATNEQSRRMSMITDIPDSHPQPYVLSSGQHILSQEQHDFEAAQFHLKQRKWLLAQLASVTRQLKTEDILRADGSNFRQWDRNLREISSTNLSGEEFYNRPSDNLTFEKLGKAILLASIHRSLASSIQGIRTAREMYVHLKNTFQPVTRAAQMDIWRRLMSFKFDPTTPTAVIASSLKAMDAELNALNADMGSDVFLGFVLQTAVMSSSAGFRGAFEQRVEESVRQDPSSSCPSFDTLIHILEICKQQHQLTEGRAVQQASLAASPPPSPYRGTFGDAGYTSVF